MKKMILFGALFAVAVVGGVLWAIHAVIATMGFSHV